MIPEKKEKKKETTRKKGHMPAFAGGISIFHAELDPAPAGVRMAVVGVRSVSDLSPTFLSLTTEKGEIEIRGERLSLTVFENQTVGIIGHIEEIKLQYGKH